MFNPSGLAPLAFAFWLDISETKKNSFFSKGYNWLRRYSAAAFFLGAFGNINILLSGLPGFPSSYG
jgi:hypothetical protein